MRYILIASLIAAASAAINGPCSVGSTPGVCISTTSCSAGGGTTHSGYCPNDPADVKCCTKTCGSGGTCRFTSSCSSGNTVSGLCPGPTDFKCCLPGSGSCTPPLINTATVNLIKEFEGFVPSPAPDPIGLPTVGYGHLCQTSGCGEVPYSFPLSVAEATSLLMTDSKKFTKCLSDYLSDSVRLNANQFGALTSWAFNMGCGAVQTSTLVKRLNNGENPTTVASQELPKWVYAGGQILQGLVRRRNAEIALFKVASSVIAHPPC